MSPRLEIKSANAFLMYDNNENLFFQGSGSQEWVSLNDISDYVKIATINTEDKNFYKHFGFDPLRIMKALYVNVRGSGSTKISTSNPNSISPSLESVDESYGETKLINPNIDMRVYEEVRMSTDDLYKSISKKQINNIDFKNMKDIIYKDLIDYQEDFKTVIDEIKAYDKDFDVKDYKVVYHMVSENEGFGYLNIYYYIDGKIETNKVYSALINDYIITSINLVGVRKENANITNKLDENSIIKIITEFELNKQQKILDNIELEYKNVNNLLKNNKINIDNLNDNVSRASERYYYDYNTNELQYQLSLTIGFENDSMDINEYVINL